jgi:hypothetical protein
VEQAALQGIARKCARYRGPEVLEERDGPMVVVAVEMDREWQRKREPLIVAPLRKEEDASGRRCAMGWHQLGGS